MSFSVNIMQIFLIFSSGVLLAIGLFVLHAADKGDKISPNRRKCRIVFLITFIAACSTFSLGIHNSSGSYQFINGIFFGSWNYLWVPLVFSALTAFCVLGIKFVSKYRNIKQALHHHKRELSDTQRYMAAKTEEARTDDLTRLGNRRAFYEKLKVLENNYATKGQEYLLALIDLDGMKFINDHYGHLQGDQLLQEFSIQLNSFKEEISESYRIGGDEFAKIFYISKNESRFDLEPILNVICKNLQKSSVFQRVGASVGCARFAEVDGDIDQLFHLADKRMYQNKYTRRYQQATSSLRSQVTKMAIN